MTFFLVTSPLTQVIKKITNDKNNKTGHKPKNKFKDY